MPPPAHSEGAGAVVVSVRARVRGPVGGKCARVRTDTHAHAHPPRGQARGPPLAVAVRIIYRAPTLPASLPPSGCFCLFVFLEKVMIWGLDHLLAYW